MSVTISRIQTASGKLSITPEYITIEHPGFPSAKIENIARSTISSVTHRMTVPAVFGRGGAYELTILLIAGGKPVVIKAISHKDMPAILEALGLPPVA